MVSGMRARLRSRPMLVFLVLVVVSAGSVYAGTRLRDDAQPAVERARADGSLVADPRPLSLEDLSAVPTGSASEAVLRLWYWGQWGSPPNVVAAYAPEVVSGLGAANIAGAYSLKRASMVASRPRITGEVRGERGTVVTLEAQRRNTQPEHYAYTLERVNGGWLVRFDTLLESAIAAWAQVDAMPDPNAADVPAAAAKAGIDAARRFREIAVE
jgi:hypothetical protein